MANRGKKIEILDNDDNLLYPMTSANCVRFGNTGNLVGDTLENVLFDVGDLKTGFTNLDNEVSEARNSKTTRYPNLKTRLDAIEDNIGAGGGSTVDQEVKDARTDKKGFVHQTLKDRLDAMEDGSTNIQNIANQAQQTANQAQQTANQAQQEIDDAKDPSATLKEKLDGINDKFDEYLPLAGGTMTGNIVLTNNNALLKGLNTQGAEIKIAQLADNDRLYLGDENNYTYIKGTNVEIDKDLIANGTSWFKGNVLHDGGNVTISSDANSFLYNINSHQRGTMKIGCPDATSGVIDTDLANISIKKPIIVSGNVRLDGSSRSFQIDAAGRTNDVVKIDANNGDVKLGSTSFKATLMANADPKWSNGTNEYVIWNQNNMPVESGDWSPQFTASNGGTVTYNSRGGKYHRVGNMVIVTFNLIAVNPVNFSGQINVTNLPFANNTGTHVGCTLFAVRGFNVGAEANNRQICAYIRPGESRIIFNYSDTTATTSNIAVLEHSHLLRNNQIEISATAVYKIN